MLPAVTLSPVATPMNILALASRLFPASCMLSALEGRSLIGRNCYTTAAIGRLSHAGSFTYGALKIDAQ